MGGAIKRRISAVYVSSGPKWGLRCTQCSPDLPPLYFFSHLTLPAFLVCLMVVLPVHALSYPQSSPQPAAEKSHSCCYRAPVKETSTSCHTVRLPSRLRFLCVAKLQPHLNRKTTHSFFLILCASKNSHQQLLSTRVCHRLRTTQTREDNFYRLSTHSDH